jgi:carbamate kinase
MRIVVALGGNALARRGEAIEVGSQERRVAEAAERLEPLAREHEIVITHGNGPQVGWLGLGEGTASRPLDALDAETEGLIGYWIERELANRLPGRDVATLLTRVAVDGADSAFAKPSKPVGAIYDEAEARRLAEKHGWTIARESAGWRRVVPSPEPRAILGLRAIESLLAAGIIVVCAGGGGIPVVCDSDGRQRGIEAVIDKDLVSSKLATALHADALLLLTDVPAVYADWTGPAREPLGVVTPTDLRTLRFEPGSMAPKVEAACRFVESGGGFAGIGALEAAGRVLDGTSGTRVVAGATTPG